MVMVWVLLRGEDDSFCARVQPAQPVSMMRSRGFDGDGRDEAGLLFVEAILISRALEREFKN
jgi:hypothetical protein